MKKTLGMVFFLTVLAGMAEPIAVRFRMIYSQILKSKEMRNKKRKRGKGYAIQSWYSVIFCS